jgi:DNA-binding transcriptional regulator LsrR (DeoR family)
LLSKPLTSESMLDAEAGLAARAAWLYFAGGLTQAEIASRLSVPTTKAHRLIARANRDGLVRVFIDGPIIECVALEEALAARYGLGFCRVAPDLDEGALPLKALGLAGAAFLRSALERGEDAVIGVGHGRTLAAVVDHLPSTPANVRFVSFLGGLTRKFAANPFDVIHRLAERTGAEAYFMPVPAFANTAEDKAVLLAQVGIADVLKLAEAATLVIAGIGEVDDANFLTTVGCVGPEEIAELKRAGARGEVLGHYFDAEGGEVVTDLTARATSMPADRLAGRRLVAIAGGPAKTQAMHAVLSSGLVQGLITDEATARRLVESGGASRASKKNGQVR